VRKNFDRINRIKQDEEKNSARLLFILFDPVNPVKILSHVSGW
jgi:hypothetical protein